MGVFSAKQNMVRALAIVIPAIMFSSFYMKTLTPFLLSLVFAWALAWVFARYVKLQDHAVYSAVLVLVLDYCYASYKAFMALVVQGLPVLANLHKVFLASGVFALLSFGVLLPAWLIFFGLDQWIIKAIKTKKIAL